MHHIHRAPDKSIHIAPRFRYARVEVAPGKRRLRCYPEGDWHIVVTTEAINIKRATLRTAENTDDLVDAIASAWHIYYNLAMGLPALD
jgi:hypothetical protein